jgi:excisionase family DNA binding protein
MAAIAAKPNRVPRLLTVAEIAEQSGFSTKTIRRWIDRGDLRHLRFGRQIRVADEDLNAFWSQRRPLMTTGGH